MVDIGLGTKCNNCCVMCTNIMPSKIEQPRKGFIFSELKALDKNINEITFTGGEPTLRKDFFEILNFARENFKNTKITMITNGRKFTYPNFCKRTFHLVDKIITELHGEEKLHDKITKTPGSFKQTFNGIKNLIEYDFDVELRIIIHRLNYRSLNKITKIYVENFSQVRKIVILPIDIIGNANINKDKLVVKYNEILPYVEEIVDFMNDKNMNVELWHFPLCILKKKYRKFAIGETVPKKRLANMSICKNCKLEKDCSKPWATYISKVSRDEFKEIS
jgi:His-Xaa-Ser system radical SAM maturase HxsC